jgi:sigma-B regulation protein RsbQ
MPKTLERFNVKVSGPINQAIIFGHGYGCDQNMWRLVSPAFEEDYQVVLFNYAGVGKSKEYAFIPEKYATLQGYADDLLDICRSLRIESAIFVGHSVSAMIGMLAAIKEPERFDKLIMVGPSPRYTNDGDYFGGFDEEDIDELLLQLTNDQDTWAKNLAPVIMANQDRPELSKELSETICRMPPEIARQFAKVTFLSDNRADLPKLQTNTLILQCSDDLIAPEPVGKYVHKHIKNSEYVKLNATGHCPHLSEPEETIAAIKQYLSEPECEKAELLEVGMQKG